MNQTDPLALLWDIMLAKHPAPWVAQARRGVAAIRDLNDKEVVVVGDASHWGAYPSDTFKSLDRIAVAVNKHAQSLRAKGVDEAIQAGIKSGLGSPDGKVIRHPNEIEDERVEAYPATTHIHTGHGLTNRADKIEDMIAWAFEGCTVTARNRQHTREQFEAMSDTEINVQYARAVQRRNAVKSHRDDPCTLLKQQLRSLVEQYGKAVVLYNLDLIFTDSKDNDNG